MIDAHVHLWRIGRNDCRWPGPDLAAIHRDFEVAELLEEMNAGGMAQALLVQSQESEADTRWLLDIAAGEPRIVGVVGWVDLAAGDAPARIDALSAAGPLVGLRPMVQDRADNWYDDPALRPGLAHTAARGLVLDALVRPRHLASLGRLAARMPALTILIDHGAKPEPDRFEAWAQAIGPLAAHRNIACKLSGLLTEQPAGEEDPAVVRGWMDLMMAHFGPGRLVWGSDWPVVMLKASYRQWRDIAWNAVAAADRPAIFGGNAARLYRLART